MHRQRTLDCRLRAKELLLLGPSFQERLRVGSPTQVISVLSVCDSKHERSIDQHRLDKDLQWKTNPGLRVKQLEKETKEKPDEKKEEDRTCV